MSESSNPTVEAVQPLSSADDRALARQFQAKFGARPWPKLLESQIAYRGRLQAALESGDPEGLLPRRKIPGVILD